MQNQLNGKKKESSMNSHSQSKTTTSLFAALVLACFALLPSARAVTPTPDGAYPGFNTAEGLNILFWHLQYGSRLDGSQSGHQCGYHHCRGCSVTLEQYRRQLQHFGTLKCTCPNHVRELQHGFRTESA